MTVGQHSAKELEIWEKKKKRSYQSDVAVDGDYLMWMSERRASSKKNVLAAKQ